MSAVPSEIRIATTGLTVFENALDVVDASDWHLADVAADAAASALLSRYHVGRATTDGAIVDGDAPIDRLFNGESTSKSIRTRVHTSVPVDLYVVIMAGTRAQAHSDRHVMSEVGEADLTVQNATADRDTFREPMVLDAKTFKTLGVPPLQDTPRSVGWIGRDDAPSEPLEGFEWHDYWHEMSSAQQDLIEDHIKRLLARSVAFTIRETTLGL